VVLLLTELVLLPELAVLAPEVPEVLSPVLPFSGHASYSES